MKNNTSFGNYHVFYDNNGMVDYCEKDNIVYYPFRGEENMSGLISFRNLEKGLIIKTIELRRMSY